MNIQAKLPKNGISLKDRFFSDIQTLEKFIWFKNNCLALMEENEIKEMQDFEVFLSKKVLVDLRRMINSKYTSPNIEGRICKIEGCGKEIVNRHHRAKTCSMECSEKNRQASFSQLVQKSYDFRVNGFKNK